MFAIQVFTKVIDPQSCGGVAPCIGAFSSDVIAGLERVYAVALSGDAHIASVNMSLGGNLFTAPCNNEPYKPIIDNLRSIGIATVVASGNSGIPFAISSPALYLVGGQRGLDEQGRYGVGVLQRRVVPVAAGSR